MKKGLFSILNILLLLAVLIIINVIASRYYGHWDLTEDKRYSLTEPTKDLLQSVDEEIYIQVLLEGTFPAGFKRLKENTSDLLEEFNSYSGNLDIQFIDPSAGSVEQINQTREQLSKDGIRPQNLSFMDGDELTNKLIYPYAIFRKGQKSIAVNMLEPQSAGMSEEATLNNSVSLLEYKFADAIQKLTQTRRANILLTEGNGELSNSEVAAMMMSLREFYNIGRINLDSTYRIHPEVDVLIVARPRVVIDQKEQFIIDQFIMKGGNVIWLIDKMNVNLDSINVNKFYVAPEYDTGLDDLFFKYGVRFQNNYVLDIECTRIPQVVGASGGEAQQVLIPWPYHVMAASQNNHPSVNNMDRVNFKFPSTIDIIETRENIKKTILFKSSPYTMYQRNPTRLNFEILKYGLEEEKFNKEPQNLAVLVEGKFRSAFENRVPESFQTALNQIGESYQNESVGAKQLFVSDADFVKNLFDANTGKFSPMGYNKWEQKTYKGNQTFMMNSIENMLDQKGVLQARSKEVKLRLLDTVKAKKEKVKWRLINILFPLLMLLFFGLAYNFQRKRRYGR